MPLKYREAEKLLLKHGWQLLQDRGKGSHRRYRKGNQFWTMPWHGGGNDVSKGLEKELFKLLAIKK